MKEILASFKVEFAKNNFFLTSHPNAVMQTTMKTWRQCKCQRHSKKGKTIEKILLGIAMVKNI